MMTKKSNDSPALAPQKYCLDCGGLHIGSTYCPFTCCSECGIKTDICCSDCKINTGSSVRVCPNCMDKHESRVKCTPALAEPAAPAQDIQHRSAKQYRDPTAEELKSPIFNAIWEAIKGWDMSRESNGLYSGATGTDVCIIWDALAAAPSKGMDELRELLGKITPGPWILCHHLKSIHHDESCPCGYRGSIWGADEQRVVCEIGVHAIPGEEGMQPDRYERPVELANAQLIAMAPDLLKQVLAGAAPSSAQDEYGNSTVTGLGLIDPTPQQMQWIKAIEDAGCQIDDFRPLELSNVRAIKAEAELALARASSPSSATEQHRKHIKTAYVPCWCGKYHNCGDGPAPGYEYEPYPDSSAGTPEGK